MSAPDTLTVDILVPHCAPRAFGELSQAKRNTVYCVYVLRLPRELQRPLRCGEVVLLYVRRTRVVMNVLWLTGK